MADRICKTKVDCMGRIGIPLGVMRDLNIREGDTLDIEAVTNGGFAVHKSNQIIDNVGTIRHYAHVLSRTLNRTVLVTDTEQVIACCNQEMGFMAQRQTLLLTNSAISNELENSIRSNQAFRLNADSKTPLRPLYDADYEAIAVAPILQNDSAVGSVIILLRDGEKLPPLAHDDCDLSKNDYGYIDDCTRMAVELIQDCLKRDR